MLVKDIMRSPAVAIAPETKLEDAYRTMREKGIRHLPVLDSGRLVGVITDRDLRLATSSLAPSPFPQGSRVDEVMSRTPLTADRLDPVEDAARTMRERKIGCLPVVANGTLVGIITGLDLLDALIRMTGVDKPSGRLEIRLADQPGELARLTSLMARAADSTSARSSRCRKGLGRLARCCASGRSRPTRSRRTSGARSSTSSGPPKSRTSGSPRMASVIYHPAYRSYSFGDDHPFSPLRLDMTLELCAALGHPLETVEPEPASREDLLGVHEEYYVRRVEALSAGRGGPRP